MTKCLITILMCLLVSARVCLAQYWPSVVAAPDTVRQTELMTSKASTQLLLDQDPFWVSDESALFATGMMWRDCNLDGSIDLFISNGNDMAIAPNSIFLSNEGNLPTAASWHSSNSAYTGHCAVGDIDDNGYPDFLVANFLGDGRFNTANRSDLYLNLTGIPNTTPDWQTGDSMMTFSCALGDVDGDGDLDAAFATGTGYIDEYTPDRVYFNDNGTLETLPGWMSTPLTAALDVTWGDVDNDGDLDLAFCYDFDGAAVYYNDGGNIETSPSWESDDAQAANTLIFGDVNNDGWLDLIVAFNYQLSIGGYFRVYYNDGTGQLSTTAGWQSGSNGYGSGIALYDYDNDGDDDLAAGRWWSQAMVYENVGGTFTEDPVWLGNPSTVVEEMAWVDVDAHAVEEVSDVFYADGGRKLFYVTRHPLHAIDSVLVDGEILENSGYCYDLVSGWVSLGQSPDDSVVIYHKYSIACDLAISNWDTSNMIFQNQVLSVSFFADVRSGWVPVEVHFSDSSIGVTQWEWDFGDGHTSTERDPVHIYEDCGPFDVSLSALFPDRWRERTIENMICVIADTIEGGRVVGSPGSKLELSVSLRNNFPVSYVKLPVEYAGALPLSYDSFSTVGCRTEYFAAQDYLHYDIWFNDRLTIRLRTALDGSQEELPPGNGDIVKLYFTVGSEADLNEETSIEFDGYSSGTSVWEPMLFGSVIDLRPATNSGSVTWSCCEGIRGNVDGDAEEQVTIEDVQYFVDWTFGEAEEPGCRNEIDLDGSGRIDIEDIVYLVNFVFGSGPPPVGCN